MIGWLEVFGKIITKVCTVRLPVNKEVTLFGMVSYPVEPRVYCLGALLLDDIICNPGSIYVICLYWSERLGMTKLMQGGTNGDCLFFIEEECLNICFLCRYKNIIDGGGLDMDGTIDR